MHTIWTFVLCTAPNKPLSREEFLLVESSRLDYGFTFSVLGLLFFS